MSKTTGCIMKGFMWAVGIASLVYGIYFLTLDTSDWIPVEAAAVSSRAGMTDEDGNATYDITYEYVVDGVKYTHFDNEYRQPAQGEKITLYHDPNDPNHTITSQGEMGMAGCIGVVFGLVCILSMVWGVIKSRRNTEPPAADGNIPG